MYDVKYQKAIILVMRYGFIALGTRRVGFIRRIRHSHTEEQDTLWTPTWSYVETWMTWNIHPPVRRGEIQISSLYVAPLTSLATINNRCAYFVLKFHSSSKWNFTVVRTEILPSSKLNFAVVGNEILQ